MCCRDVFSNIEKCGSLRLKGGVVECSEGNLMSVVS